MIAVFGEAVLREVEVAEVRAGDYGVGGGVVWFQNVDNFVNVS